MTLACLPVKSVRFAAPLDVPGGMVVETLSTGRSARYKLSFVPALNQLRIELASTDPNKPPEVVYVPRPRCASIRYLIDPLSEQVPAEVPELPEAARRARGKAA